MNLKTALCLMSIFFFGVGTVSAELTILSKRATGNDQAQVRFRYQNDSSSTLATVKIICSAMGGASRRQKGIVYINNHLGGGIKPGFSISGEVEVTLGGNKPDAIKCKEEPRSLIYRD